MNGVSFSGSSMALQIAALQVETTNEQQAADRAARDAARDLKLAEMKADEETLRDQADAIMQDAVIGGALRVGGGVAKFSSGANKLEASSNELDAKQLDLDAGRYQSTGNTAGALDARATSLAAQEQALDASSTAHTWSTVADGFEGAQFVSTALTERRKASLEADGAQHRRLAEQAQHQIDDKSDQLRKQDEQFSQKLAVLEDLLRSAHETDRMIIRG